MDILLKLLFTFFKIGLFSFGGGYAMIPFMQREIIEKHQWLSSSEFVDIIGISQMTPGPVSVNSATFVGYKVGGVVGSIFATLGITVISFILVSIASKAIDKFKESKYLKAALLGMRPVLIALIINAFISLAKDAYVDVKSIIITLIVGGCLFSKKIHPIVIIVLAGLLGIIFWGII
ncbi:MULTISPECIES: chromate transporter [Clostridium]|uniref:Chromate transporter n=1 Tax=Clostridium paraputrificum TaxID=29363 RepID=A0A1B8RLZ5_9CLOT|nr:MULTISPECIES: chromate transporter [Clostridium]MDB2102897.1 chromate transporter [Clostridium paraputrificum]MDC0803827.1 chromate transporter [Clostridium paraputrificum]MDU1823935.1 chromate transporter [Clostridium sp.]MDU1840990.1 chromate transporter [Clostridium sp.]MDU2691369.1 chromate transporter [Clostridium sp.]